MINIKKLIRRLLNFFMKKENVSNSNNGIINVLDSIKEHKLKKEFEESNVTIKVSSEYIKKGYSHGNYCPTALAIQSKLKEEYKAYVDYNHIQISDNNYKIIDSIPTPFVVADKEKIFDDSSIMYEYEFILPRKEYFK